MRHEGILPGKPHLIRQVRDFSLCFLCERRSPAGRVFCNDRPCLVVITTRSPAGRSTLSATALSHSPFSTRYPDYIRMTLEIITNGLRHVGPPSLPDSTGATQRLRGGRREAQGHHEELLRNLLPHLQGVRCLEPARGHSSIGRHGCEHRWLHEGRRRHESSGHLVVFTLIN